MRVLEGSLEVNESLLTGESDNLSKRRGTSCTPEALSLRGRACCQVIHVGKTTQKSPAKQKNSRGITQSFEFLNAILKVISVMIVPLGAMFYKQYFVVGESLGNPWWHRFWHDPGGVVLFTSVPLTLGAPACKENTGRSHEDAP